jgi:hypothetical protein
MLFFRLETPPEGLAGGRRVKRDPKFEVQGSKFRKPRTFPRLARPVLPSSPLTQNPELKTQNVPVRLACPAFLASLVPLLRIPVAERN